MNAFRGLSYELSLRANLPSSLQASVTGRVRDGRRCSALLRENLGHVADDRLGEAPRAISKIPVDTRLTVSSLANLTLSDGLRAIRCTRGGSRKRFRGRAR
jgi:hypothetical protein